MAGFHTHLIWGGLWGAAAGFTAFTAGWSNLPQSAAAAVLGVIGSGLPDVDGRHMKPRQILLGVLGVGIPVLLAERLAARRMTHEELFCWAVAAFLIVRYGLGYWLGRYSRHRGAFHSIPAALLCGEAVYLIFADSALTVRFVFAAAAGGGYLSHLLLDEFCAYRLIGATEKKSAGTAFTWSGGSGGMTVLLYLAILLLGALCWWSSGGAPGFLPDRDFFSFRSLADCIPGFADVN